MNPSSFQQHYYYSHQGDDDQADVKKTKMGGKSKGGVRLSTDPQSVAARERRHRISHRLKTLQSMVPGASKLDTVSLLDHAIHYVHFLNSQIRFHQLLLLSNNSTYSDVAPDPLPNPPPPSFDYDRYFGVVDASAAAHTALPPPREVDAGAFGFEEEGCFWFDVIQGVGVRSGGSTLDF